jgi:hypothetical protein
MVRSRMGWIVASTIVAFAGCSSESHYRAHHDGKSLYVVLNQSVRAGDSVKKVESLLGVGKDAPGDALAAVKKFAAKLPAQYPDGFQETDQVRGYPFDDGATLYMQFRHGKLINHNPKDFTKYERMHGVAAPAGK